MSWPDAAPLGIQTPRIEHAPPSRFSSGPEAIELAAAYGLDLDPAQGHVLTGSLGEQPGGRWTTPRVGVSAPRQNGKGGIIEARELAGLLLFGERLIVHSAHEVKTALEGFLRVRAYFDNYDDLRKKVRAIHTGAGQEAIILTTGQRLRFLARSRNAGRGFSCDCLILDEAQELAAATFGAIYPTQSARPNPQTILLGTPPSPLNDGEVFTQWRTSALSGTDDRLYWAEWSAHEDLSPDDPLAASQANSALGRRITSETVEDERLAMTEEQFCRERLGRWDSDSSKQVIPADTWALLATEDLTPASPLCIGIDTRPDRTSTAISVAARRADSRTQVEVIMQRSGVEWAADYVADLVARRRPLGVVIDSVGPAASLIEPLRARGVLVTTTSASQVGQACGQLYDSALSGSLRHIDQPQLNTALAGARKRKLGDAWAWHRLGDTDITPLVATTLALWGLTSTKLAAAPKTPNISRTVYAFN